MITVIDKPKQITREDVLTRTAGLEDRQGNPVYYITLDRVAKKDVDHGTKTHGFDSTTIHMGANGFSITHKEGSYIVWHKDIVSGRGYTILAATENNLKLLAAAYYDGFWKIRESDMDKKVREMADKIEADLKQRFVQIVDSRGEPIYNDDGSPKLKSEYEVIQARRRGSRIDTYGFVEYRPPTEANSVTSEIAKEKAEREKLLEDIRKENTRLKRELAAANSTRQMAIEAGAIVNQDRDRAYFEAINPFPALRKVAKEEYGIDSPEITTKKDLIDAIMEKVANPGPTTIE